MIHVKRVNEPTLPSDGHRVLVDRLWPRGITKEAAALDEWLKILAPSTELRVWFDHRADRWEEFQSRYRLELSSEGAIAELRRLQRLAAKGEVTLLTASKAVELSQARALKSLLEKPGALGGVDS